MTLHQEKEKVILAYAKMYSTGTFVESGTLYGEMVEAMREVFRQIYSIELQHDYFISAKNKFEPFPHIHIIQGDSGKVLPSILGKLEEATLFFLDGHYSGGATAQGDKDCPLLEELSCIFNATDLWGHVILIDDARLMGKDKDFPSIETIRRFVKEHRPGLVMAILPQDIIAITPAKKGIFPIPNSIPLMDDCGPAGEGV